MHAAAHLNKPIGQLLALKGDGRTCRIRSLAPNQDPLALTVLVTFECVPIQAKRVDENLHRNGELISIMGLNATFHLGIKTWKISIFTRNRHQFRISQLISN